MKNLSFAVMLFSLAVHAGWFASDKIEVEITRAEKTGDYIKVYARVKNHSDKVVKFFGSVKLFDRSDVYFAEGHLKDASLAPGAQEEVYGVISSNKNPEDVGRWQAIFDWTTSFYDAKGNRLELKKEDFKIVTIAPKSSVIAKPPSAEGSSVKPASYSGKCDVTKVKLSFVQSCQYAGILQYESTGSKPKKERIESVCRCVATSFNVESLDSLLKGSCEYSIPAARAVMSFDKPKLACGSF